MKNENALHITRENYEEYFILYIDNELNDDECKAVESFASQHADVAKEFDALLQTKLSADERILFQQKDELLRTEGVTINESNYEEYFLLYIDNELSKPKREETELFVLQHPHLQAAFTAVKQTILPAEKIVFENKNELLRVEDKRRFLLRNWVMAVAALFAGVCITGWWFMDQTSDDNIKPKVAVIATHTDSNHTAQPLVQNIDSSAEFAAKDALSNQEKTEPVKQPVPVKEETKAIASSTLKNKVQPTVTKNRQPQVADVNNNEDIAQQTTLPEDITLKEDPHPFRIEQKAKSNKEVAAVNNDKPHTNDEVSNDEPDVTSSTYKPYSVGYKEINTQQDEEDKSLYVGGFNLNKGKVKGLLKKAGKLFGNKAREEANNNQQMHIDNSDTDSNNQ